MGAHIFTGAEAKALRDAIRHGGEPCPPDCSGECVAAYAGALMRLRDAAPDLAESVVHHAARAERAEAERDAAIKRATNAERMRDAFVATSVAFAVDMIDKPDAMARCAAERDAAVTQAEELTRALRAAQSDLARAWAERSVEQSIESFRASFRRMGVPENTVKVTWDTEALWARVRFVVPGMEPRRIVEHIIRYDSSKHPRKNVGDVLWTLARWLDERSRRVKKGETFAAAFEGTVLA